MILYGRMLSPYARRVAIQAGFQGHKLETREMLTTGDDFEKLKGMSPVARIPVLELDDGTRLIETWAICDWLDETAPNGRRMVPASGMARRDCLQRLAVANGATEKAVALVYDRNRRPEEYHWMDWHQRLVAQIQGGLTALDAMVPDTGWMGGEALDISDVATAIAWETVKGSNPWVLEPGYDRLEAFARRARDVPEIAAARPQS